jgi:hypothetical protein
LADEIAAACGYEGADNAAYLFSSHALSLLIFR